MNGILSYQYLQKYVIDKHINSAKKIGNWQFQPNSLDLRLGSTAYRVRASFLTIDDKVENIINKHLMYEVDISKGAILEKGCVYLIKLQESLSLPRDVYGKSNPKSTAGRLDIFTRVVTDYSYRYNAITLGYKGNLYIEVSPISFTIKVKKGDSLNQIRLYKQHDNILESWELEEYYKKFPLLYNQDNEPIEIKSIQFRDGLYMRINITTKDDKEIIGYKSKKNSNVIDISKKDFYEPKRYWDEILSCMDGHTILEPEEFYIFASQERIVIPPDLCGEMIPYDPESGEMRVHYAGFFDTGFGYNAKNGQIKGAKAVLEIRPHDVPYLVNHGQILFRIVFSRVVNNPTQLYGEVLNSNYQFQDLCLSKHFKTRLQYEKI